MNIQKSSLNSNPIISIVIPCYNRGERLSTMLADVIEGIPKDAIEIILSDDSSDESSSSSLLEFSRKFPDIVVYRKNENRMGFGGNLVQGIHLSKGKYLFFLMDDDSLVVENLAIFIEDVLKNNYHIAISSYHLDHVTTDTLEAFKLPVIEVLGNLRHAGGLIIRKELVDEALKNEFVLSAIDKVPQYPVVPIGLYCSSKYTMHKYHLTVVKLLAVEDSGSNWTPDAILPHFSTLTSRANQIETYIEMIHSIMSSANIKSFPFIQLQKSALDEQIYMLLEEGVNRTFKDKTVSAFYKRSAINSIRWLLFNRIPWRK
tara:strand:- start:26 stop:973 length:948 start_codon:yes stop_codon:yes gene_type:complete